MLLSSLLYVSLLLLTMLLVPLRKQPLLLMTPPLRGYLFTNYLHEDDDHCHC